MYYLLFLQDMIVLNRINIFDRHHTIFSCKNMKYLYLKVKNDLQQYTNVFCPVQKYNFLIFKLKLSGIKSG